MGRDKLEKPAGPHGSASSLAGFRMDRREGIVLEDWWAVTMSGVLRTHDSIVSGSTLVRFGF